MKNDFEPMVSLKTVGNLDVGKNLTLYKAITTLAEELATYDREVAYVLSLDHDNHPLHASMVHQGTINSSVVKPSELLKPALIDRKAEKIILFHNHPSGDNDPSQADIDTTKLMKETCKKVGINLLEHFTVGYDGGLKSIFEVGHLRKKNIKESTDMSRKSLKLVRTALNPKYQSPKNTRINSSDFARRHIQNLCKGVNANKLVICGLTTKNQVASVMMVPLEKFNNPQVQEELYRQLILSHAARVITAYHVRDGSPEVDNQIVESWEKLDDFLELIGCRHLDTIMNLPNRTFSAPEVLGNAPYSDVMTWMLSEPSVAYEYHQPALKQPQVIAYNPIQDSYAVATAIHSRSDDSLLTVDIVNGQEQPQARFTVNGDHFFDHYLESLGQMTGDDDFINIDEAEVLDSCGVEMDREFVEVWKGLSPEAKEVFINEVSQAHEIGRRV